MTYKTTRDDFNLFESECKRLIRDWGLTEFNIKIGWEEPASPGWAGQASRSVQDSAVCLELTTEWREPVTRQMIIQTAKHEVLHALLAKIEYLACNRFSTEDQIYQAEHELINRLMRLIK